MLQSLSIENLALLKKAELTFENGMSVLTGETGAGKSVIITALSLALGARAEKEWIRHGAKFTSVEAAFDISFLPSSLKSSYKELMSDNSLKIYREFSTEGSSKIKINGQSVSLTRLKEITASIAEILGQHANQELMNENNHLRFLDRLAKLDKDRDLVTEIYNRWRKSADELKKIINRQEQLMNERELLLFQKNEIENSSIQIGEEEKLSAELKILSSAQNLITSASLVQNILNSEEDSLTDRISRCKKEISKMSEVDQTLEKQVEELTDLEYRLDDFRRFIEQYGSSIVDNPARIEEINLRLDEIYKLKKKYGGSEPAILESLILINEKLKNNPDVKGLIETLELETHKLFKEYSLSALKLSNDRKKAAGKLEKLVLKELKELAIDNGGFKFEFIYEADPQGVIINGKAVKPFPSGLENGRILFSANPGEPLKSLVKTASGGEISRVLLALKSAESAQNKKHRPVLVFDEVDAGIGGKTGIEVGKKLKKLSNNGQLIVVTHLHQIARLADHHYLAEKSGKSRSLINVKKLTQNEIKDELKRMVALPEPA